MSRRFLLSVAVATACLAAGTACQATKAVGHRVARVFESADYVRITLDGRAAEKDPVKSLIPGWSQWRVNEPITSAPTLVYRITKPERLGRITYVRAAIHRAFDGAYSSQPDFVIVSRNPSETASQLQPNTRYDLSAPIEGFRILDVTGHEVPQVELDHGADYQLILTLKADRSQTAIVYFTTA